MLAFDLLSKQPVAADLTQGKTINNGKMDVPSVLLTPVAVTKDNVKDTVVEDKFWTAQQICTAAYRGRLQGSRAATVARPPGPRCSAGRERHFPLRPAAWVPSCACR